MINRAPRVRELVISPYRALATKSPTGNKVGWYGRVYLVQHDKVAISFYDGHPTIWVHRADLELPDAPWATWQLKPGAVWTEKT